MRDLQIGEFLHRAVTICKAVQAEHGKMLKAFTAAIEGHADILALRVDVEAFAVKFSMPGFSIEEFK